MQFRHMHMAIKYKAYCVMSPSVSVAEIPEYEENIIKNLFGIILHLTKRSCYKLCFVS